MAKIVRYNGGTGSYYSCTEPTELVKGQEYEVTSVDDRGWQTDYSLKGVVGHFNAVWFDDVSNEPNTYMALMHTVPTVGERMRCSKLEIIDGRIQLSNWTTSTVQKVEDMGNHIYTVTTRNSTYIVQVG